MHRQTIVDYEPEPRAVVEGLLHQLSRNPSDLALYKKLYEAALYYKAGGGPPLGLRARVKKLPTAPNARLLHYLKLWAFDIGNSARVIHVYQAVGVCDTPDGAFEPVATWLKRMIRRMRADV